MNTDIDTTKLKFVIRDRGGPFTDAFDAVFVDAGLRVIKSPPQAPKANAHPLPGALQHGPTSPRHRAVVPIAS
ncbi:hypothetical protein [Nonomuraea terrae]|uniref:hypothetical protein n=1 Tax=Nonomuraea terrae TaxID=2530383 RepID=UPI001CB6CD79|nr:hypothetical protein [Nonomuraea terrae]